MTECMNNIEKTWRYVQNNALWMKGYDFIVVNPMDNIVIDWQNMQKLSKVIDDTESFWWN